MAKPGGLLGTIGESFEDIGKDVVRESVKAPKDITGKALESLGMSGGKKKPKGQTTNTQPASGSEGDTQNPQDAQHEELKRTIARAALEELSGKKPKQKEFTVWEKIQKEEEEKKELEKKKKEEAAKKDLPKTSSRRPRGDLYGLKAKKAAAEMSRNVRQD